MKNTFRAVSPPTPILVKFSKNNPETDEKKKELRAIKAISFENLLFRASVTPCAREEGEDVGKVSFKRKKMV